MIPTWADGAIRAAVQPQPGKYVLTWHDGQRSEHDSMEAAEAAARQRLPGCAFFTGASGGACHHYTKVAESVHGHPVVPVAYITHPKKEGGR